MSMLNDGSNYLQKFVRRAAVVLFIISSMSTAQATPAWYYGKISRIYTFNGGFVLTFDTTALDDCIHKYVYFRDSVLGEKTVSRSLSFAMSADAQDRRVGVVIDKAINGPGGRCDSNGSMDIQG